MEDKRLEDIEFRQDFIEKDSSSPLHLIREKEMEISGKVLKAKREAEEIISEARREAAASSSNADGEGESRGDARSKEILAEFEAEIVNVGKGSESDLKAMKKKVSTAMPKAIDAVVEMVTDV